MSIKKSLKTSLILLTALPLILLTAISYIISYNKYADLSKISAAELAKNYARGFESQLNVQIAELEGLAQANSIENLLLESYNDYALGTDSSYYEPVVELLDSSSAYMDGNVHFYIYDVNGYFIASSSGTTSGDWSEYIGTPVGDISETTIMQSQQLNHDGDDTIDLVTPVKVKNTTVGLIRSDISSDYFGGFISSSDTGAFIITSDGNYLFNSEGFGDNENLKSEISGIFNSNSQNGYLNASALSVENIYGYQKLTDMDWIYVIRQSGSQYKKILSALPAIFIIILAAILIIAVRVSSVLTHKYTSPIFELKANMEQAASGNLDVKCSIQSNDEFGELSDSFNSMMSIISDNYDELSHAKNILEANEIELKKNYNHIEQLAYHDGLTGLYNRVAFMKYAYDMFNEDGKNLTRHSIFFIDLDNFKNVNDTLGHDYGDLLLKQVSDHLTKCVTSDDILARTGGDEFLILKKNVSGNEELAAFATTLTDLVKKPFDLDGEIAHVSMSVGIATFPNDGLSITELIKNADIAMYYAKTSGKNGYSFFNSYMEDDVNKRNELADILTTVIEKGEVYLQYQPQVDVETGRITGHEALMRIESDLLGFVPPSEFIPVAEDTGIINELGEWALYEACRFNQKIIKSGFDDMRVSVNISTAQLKDSRLIDIIRSIPAETGMSLDHLEIEITESVLMDSFEHNLDLINQMKALGATIALDDFGTGYSSFNYLTKIPIDTLKIDKTFIQGICDNEKDRYIADSIISLAHKMHITVIAEGVEDIDQLSVLQRQFCDTLQGYLFSKPLNANDFIELVIDNKKKLERP